MLDKPAFPEPADDEGVWVALPALLERPEGTAKATLFALLLMAPRAERAVEEEFRERVVATPLSSFSDSSVGSRLTNSFCSNWTTT